MAALERHGPNGFDYKFLDDTRASYSVGKSPDNDLVLDGDDTISRLHAQFERIGPAWCITDLGARNGTFVNGERIPTKRQLRDGDVIRLGVTDLIYRDSRARGDGTTKPI